MSGTTQTYTNFYPWCLKQINILNGLFFPMSSGASIVVLNSFCIFRVVSLTVSVAFSPSLLLRPVPSCLLRFLGRGVGLLLEYMVFLVQDSDFDIEVPPPIGSLQGFCAEVDRELWDVLQGFEMEGPSQHIVGHLRFSGWVVVYISSILVNLCAIFLKGSDR